MNILYTKKSWLIVFFLLSSINAKSEPYLAFKNNLFCSACHINPIGGGARNTYGAYYGTQVLPQTGGSLTQFDAGSIVETLRIGANFRANYTQVNNKKGEDSNTFETQSGSFILFCSPRILVSHFILTSN